MQIISAMASKASLVVWLASRITSCRIGRGMGLTRSLGGGCTLAYALNWRRRRKSCLPAGVRRRSGDPTAAKPLFYNEK
jgi:hypothetical protein